MNDPQPPRRSQQDGFTAIVGVLSLIVAALTFFYGDEIACKIGFQFSFCAKPASPPDRSGGGGTNNGPTGSNQQGPGGSWSAYWKGRVLLPNNAGLELDNVPAAPVNGGWTGTDLNFDNREALGEALYAGPGLAEWLGPGVPDANACYEALISSPVGKVDPEPGHTLCVGTTENRVARLQIVDAQYQGVLFDATVWKSP